MEEECHSTVRPYLTFVVKFLDSIRCNNKKTN